ncbi:MAG: hypothetical protein LUD15_09390, partial [Bacteroides sp.]|nr:hypothetical protein [Bacteroides sp.]
LPIIKDMKSFASNNNSGVQHHSQPGAIYLSQCTELGTIYTPEELLAITTLAYKPRFIVGQFSAYLTEDLWYENACHTNRMATLLHTELKAFPFVRFTQEPGSNQLFLTMLRFLIDKPLEEYFFYFWNEAENEIRLVTSFDTTPEDIAGFIDTVKKLNRNQKSNLECYLW